MSAVHEKRQLNLKWNIRFATPRACTAARNSPDSFICLLYNCVSSQSGNRRLSRIIATSCTPNAMPPPKRQIIGVRLSAAAMLAVHNHRNSSSCRPSSMVSGCVH